jgi:(E)-2-((N-methylformamido)methylene)succinate hydrolase
MSVEVDRLAPPSSDYDLVGNGEAGLPAIVLIHGVGLSRAMWSAQVGALRGRYRVMTLDMLGHGTARMPAQDATLDDYGDHVAGLLAAAGIRKAVLVGFSMGALVARAFAFRYPERLAALVLLNGVFERSDEVRGNILQRVAEVQERGPDANVDAAIDRWFSPEFLDANPDYIADLRKAFAANDPQGYETSYRLFATQDSYGADRLADIAVPVLVATGELDVGSTPAMAKALAARIPGAALRILPGARHMMPVELPEATNALLLDFLETLPVEERGFGEAE